MPNPDLDTIQIEAATYRRLVQHLMSERADVQNVDLMAVAGFCRNCRADWYRDAAEALAITMTGEEAREAVYAMPFDQRKAQHQGTSEPPSASGSRRHAD